MRIGHLVLACALTAGVLTGAAASTAIAQQASGAPQVEEPSTYTATAPVRVLDTRAGFGAPKAAVGPAGTITLDLSARVPATARSVVLTVTGTEPTASTYVTVFPYGVERPTVSNLNISAGQTRPNAVTVTLGADRKISLFNNTGTIHLVADLAGYYAPGAGGLFTSNNQRVLDTRSGPGPVPPGGTRVVDLSKAIPVSATAVTVNLTGVNATADTFVTAWPAGTPRPTASNLNLVPGRTSAVQAVVRVGAGRKIELFNNAGSVHLVVDVQGFYTPEYGAAFTPITPTRILDTRRGIGRVGGDWTPIGPQSHVMVAPEATLPDTAVAAVVNVTGTGGTQDTYLAAGQLSGTGAPYSTLNPSAGDTVANLAAIAVQGTTKGHRFVVLNGVGSIHIIGDLAGYFTVPRTTCGQGCVHLWGSPDGHGTTAGPLYSPAAMPALSGVTAISANYAIGAGGSVWAWGPNDVGQLGNGWIGDGSTVAVPVVGLTKVVSVAAGAGNGYAVRDDGTVWSWGYAPWLGTGDQSDARVPTAVQVPGLSGIKSITASGLTVHALGSDGTVWGWGRNSLGQIGDGTTVTTRSPVQVANLKGVKAISGTMAITADGGVVTWGSNASGLLGNGTTCDEATGANCRSATPIAVAGLSDVVSVSMSSARAFAVKADGTVWGWGDNTTGGLGNGQDCLSACVVNAPVQTVDISDAKEVAANSIGGLARLADGTVKAWGNNQGGHLGIGEAWHYRVRPVAIPGLSGVTAVVGVVGGLALVP